MKSKRLNYFQNVVYKSFLSIGRPCTDRELIEYTYLSENIKPRSRRFELWKKGIIERCQKRPCEVSGKLAYVWKVV